MIVYRLKLFYGTYDNDIKDLELGIFDALDKAEEARKYAIKHANEFEEDLRYDARNDIDDNDFKIDELFVDNRLSIPPKDLNSPLQKICF